MAGCYHDIQDFKSDFNIEIARECDILEAGQDLKDYKCEKNPGHGDFIPFKNLTLDDLPNTVKSRHLLDNIKQMGKLVVRLVVNKQKVGTGYVIKYVYAHCKDEYHIQTNNHVVATDDDVKNCTVEFHYDDDSRSSVLTSRGVGLTFTCPYRDITQFSFHPVPDFIYQVDFKVDCLTAPYIVIMENNNQIVTDELISKPDTYIYHSCEDLNSSLINLMFMEWVDGSVSYLKSCYFKFQPISFYIQQSTSVEIHIDEDDGNRRVIPGDLVKFGDEFVVKISQSIFQDEVKKCRLVLNGEVISRGTRLYFEHADIVELSRSLSGIDADDFRENCPNGFWLFDFHPIPSFAKVHERVTTDMYCIGHPHGGIKMVTFGRDLGKSQERFDNQYRHITQPSPDCQCKIVSCLKYSCKTCPGSSGSFVNLVSCSGSGNAHVHFQGEKVEKLLTNGERIENINMAWTFIS